LERDLRQWPTHQILRKSSDDRQTRAGTRLRDGIRLAIRPERSSI
jgi:hypothetical protein